MATILERVGETMSLVRPLDRLAKVKSRILAVIITSGVMFVACLCIVGIWRPESDEVKMSVALAILCSIFVMLVGAISYVRIWRSQLATGHARRVQAERNEREVMQDIQKVSRIAVRRIVEKIWSESSLGGSLTTNPTALCDRLVSDQMVEEVCEEVCEEVLT